MTVWVLIVFEWLLLIAGVAIAEVMLRKRLRS
jgi:hypothetical protein